MERLVEALESNMWNNLERLDTIHHDDSKNINALEVEVDVDTKIHPLKAIGIDDSEHFMSNVNNLSMHN
jgi:hypothetical protein